MHSAKVIQFPATKQSPAQTPTKTVQDVGEDALARTGEAHGDICIFRSDLRLMLNQAPQRPQSDIGSHPRLTRDLQRSRITARKTPAGDADHGPSRRSLAPPTPQPFAPLIHEEQSHE